MSNNPKLSFFLASPSSEIHPEPLVSEAGRLLAVQDPVCLCVISITKFDNLVQLTSALFSNDTPSVSCICVGSNVRVTGKSDVGSSELVVN